MRRFSIGVIFVFIGIGVLAYTSHNEQGKRSSEKLPIAITDTGALVVAKDAYIQDQKVFATFENNSDVDVTLINATLMCAETSEELLFALGFDEEEQRFIPINLPIAKSATFNATLTGTIGDADTCTLTIINWSKHGIKE